MYVYETTQTFASYIFRLNSNYEVDCTTLKFDYIGYSPAEVSTLKTANSQVYVNIPRKYSPNLLIDSYLISTLKQSKPLIILDMQTIMIED